MVAINVLVSPSSRKITNDEEDQSDQDQDNDDNHDDKSNVAALRSQCAFERITSSSF